MLDICFNNFVGRDVSSDFFGRFVASKTVWDSFLGKGFSSEICLHVFFCRDCLVEILFQRFFGRFWSDIFCQICFNDFVGSAVSSDFWVDFVS